MKKVSKEKAPVEIKEETPQVLNIKEELDEIKHLLSVICDEIHNIGHGVAGGFR